MSRTARLIFALVALTVLLGTGAAQALPSSNGPTVDRTSGTFAAVWEWVTTVFDIKGSVSSIFDATTLGAAQMPAPATAQSDFGGFIDPNGGS